MVEEMDATAMRDSLKLDFTNAAQQIQPPIQQHIPNTGDILSAILKSPTFEKIQKDLLRGFQSPTLDMIQRDLLSGMQGKSPTIEGMMHNTAGVQQAMMSLPTPTKMLFPGEVSAEQQQYAQGFIDALRHVQQINNFKPLHSPSVLAANLTSPQPSPLGDFDAIVQAIQLAQEKEKREREVQAVQAAAAKVAADAAAAAAAAVSRASTSNTQPAVIRPTMVTAMHSLFPPTMPTLPTIPTVVHPMDIKRESPMMARSDSNRASSEESDLSDTSDSVSQSGSNSRRKKDITGMDEQDARKLERKRARNRQAASKCRQKKLARISELEEVVAGERNQQKNLDFELQMLKEEVAKLENMVRMHTNHGCPTHRM